ncbi:MAG: MBL fold metallo-hydrolase [Betaproteobacteria bacterium]|nr:MBL fold metallo-hydrolase [Betaproteobacteria bacterium]
MTHFGAANWRITDGRTFILLDPYFSRVRFTGKAHGPADSPTVPGDTRPVFGPDDAPVSDTATLDAHAARADFILISHSHFNHCMDMPYIARKTGAAVIGSESTTNVARACGVPADQLITVRGGEDYEFGAFSVKVVPSLHSAANSKRYFNSAVIPRDIKAPLRQRDYVEGGTLAYLIRFGGYEIMAFCSMNYIAREVAGLRPDVALIPASPRRLEIHDYTGRLLRALDFPCLVVATHWDKQPLAYGMSQDAELKQAESFVGEVKAVSPRARVIVPRHFETVVLARRRGRTDGAVLT